MMEVEDRWAAMHLYRKAAAVGEVPIITCPECSAELVPVVGREDYPALRCLSCRIVWDLGLGVWNQIESNIHELYERMRNNLERN